jgi:hypothetical protein
MKKFLAITAVVATFLLAGCSQIGAAATVGDTKILIQFFLSAQRLIHRRCSLKLAHPLIFRSFAFTF